MTRVALGALAITRPQGANGAISARRAGRLRGIQVLLVDWQQSGYNLAVAPFCDSQDARGQSPGCSEALEAREFCEDLRATCCQWPKHVHAASGGGIGHGTSADTCPANLPSPGASTGRASH